MTNKDFENHRKAIKNNAEWYIEACDKLDIPLSEDTKDRLRDFAETRSAPILEEYLKQKQPRAAI